MPLFTTWYCNYYVIITCLLVCVSISCVFFLQLFVYPRIAVFLGYRRTLMFGLFLFSVMSVLFPLSNRITGPIGDDMTTAMGSGFNSSTNVSDKYDFCGHHLSNESSENLVNENSVARVPARIWLWLTFDLTLWIISR